MSRIRSIHPSQWTDEHFVECSMAARLLALGLRNEADDNGIFKWSPVSLKMRLFPVDNVDVAELLEELCSRRLIMRFEAEGRSLGAIRNFRVFQNPRSPKAEHPIIDEAETFVGARAGDDTVEKKPVGRPRKQQDSETLSSHQKPFPHSVENNSERRGEESSKEDSPSDSSASELADGRRDGLSSGEGGELIAFPVADAAADVVTTAFEDFQSLRREFSPGCRPLSFDLDRRKKLTLRLRQIGGLAGWGEVLALIRGSPFLRGETSRNGFVAIDWLLEPKNLRKMHEGNFDERSHGKGSGNHGPAGATDAIRAARAALGAG